MYDSSLFYNDWSHLDYPNDTERPSINKLKLLLRWVEPVVLSRYLWLMLVGLLVLLTLIYAAVDLVIMPAYTRHDATMAVPDLIGLQSVPADSLLTLHGLDVRHIAAPFVPSKERDIVLGQDPAPGVLVKPGRRIYLRINSGSVPMVLVPNLYDLSIRQARSTLLGAKLTVGSVLRDSMPSPYQNTITRQDPEPGDSVIVGGPVNLWISSGLGTSISTVPRVIGEQVVEAEFLLHRSRLQYVVFDVIDSGNAPPNTVVRVIPPAGSEIPEGSEIRLFVTPSDSTYGPPELPGALSFDKEDR